MNGDTSPKTPPTPKMEPSSATATRRSSTIQPSSTSISTRSKLKPSASTLRGSNGTATTTRSVTSSKAPLSPSPTPTATTSIRRGLKSQDGTAPRSPTTLTSSASRRTSAAAPVPTQSTTPSRRSTTTTSTAASSMGRNATPTPTLSRRVTTTATTRTPSSTTSTTPTRRKSTLGSSINGTPTPSISRRVSTLNSASTASSRTSTPSSTTSTRSVKPAPTATIKEEGNGDGGDDDDDDPSMIIQSEIDTLTDQINEMEQQINDTKELFNHKQTEIDDLNKALDDSLSQQEEQLLESILEITEQLKEQEAIRDEALERLSQYEAQVNEQATLAHQVEEMEVAYREEMETLRETLQSKNDQLETTLAEMDKDLGGLEEASSALREEIQGIHKSHQARMTALSNQLHQEHNEELNSLLKTLDKELGDKQDSSEWANVDNKRKEMIDLERSIQNLEEKLASMDGEFKQRQEELKMDLDGKLEAVLALYKEEITQSSNHHDNQVSEIEAEHSEHISSIQSHHQEKLSAASTSITLENNEDLEKMKIDIQMELETEHEQKLQATLKEQKSQLDQVQAQLDDATKQLEALKISTSEEHDAKKQYLEQQYIDERASAITQLETNFTAKLDTLVKHYQTTLDNHRSQLEQDHLPRIKSLEEEHSQLISTLVDDHDRKVLELQSSTAAGIRASTERQLRADHETDITNLTRNHQQALEDLQSDHRQAFKALEELLENAKESNRSSTNGTASSASPQDQDNINDTGKKSENGNIESIRAQIQATLNQVHAAAITKKTAEHESRLGELKRDHILQKDRALEKMIKEFDTRLNEIKKENALAIQTAQQEHDNYIDELLTTSKNAQTEKEIELASQHQAAKDQLLQDHSSRIQSVTEEIDQHADRRQELEQLRQQMQDEIAAFKISSIKELEDKKAMMDDNELKIKTQLEAAHNAALKDMKAKHQTALDTLITQHQHEIESQSQQRPPDMEDSLADSYQEQIKQFVLEQESRTAELQDTLNRMKEQNTSLEQEQQAQLDSTRQEWITRLEDATQSVEQLSETTLLNEPIRNQMHGEAKKSQEKLIAAHTRSLETLVTTHNLAMDQLTKDHEAELAELENKIQPLVEEQTYWEEHIKKLEQDHAAQIKTITDKHDSSVETYNTELLAKQAQYNKDIEHYQTQLDDTKKQVLELHADIQLKMARHTELQKQLDDTPPITVKNEPSSSSLEKDILEKQKVLDALELEIQQVENEYRQQVEEKKAADELKNKQNEKMIHDLVIQHQQEIEKMHRHLQHLLDVKDDEINNVSYRLKTVTSARQKDIDNLQTKQRGKVQALVDHQNQLKDALATRTNSYDCLESNHRVLKDKFDQGEKQLGDLSRDKQNMQAKLAASKAENTHLLQTIHQLQSKMHKIRLG
ncbi:hypothetical protein BC941DRAFT_408510 [Chlamydoabsidia padenii]|nr:hypothetical protein BC941DRAFT_408510 [Chlamydoabsidia padenii]